MRNDSWSEEQIKILRKNYPTIKNLNDLVPLTGKSLDQIKYKAGWLKIKRDKGHGRLLSKVDQQWIKDNFNNFTNQEMADKFGCDISTIRVVLHAAKMFRIELEYWTEEQIQFLWDNYRRIGDKELAICFNLLWPEKKKGWSFKHIEKKRKYLKIKRTPDEIAAIRQRNTERDCFPGSWQGEKRVPKPEGHIVIWNDSCGNPIPNIKVNGRYTPMARHIYIKNFGPIPRGMIVSFKDDNKYNIVPENLKLITWEENGKRNSESRKLPEDVQRVKKLLEQLKLKLISLTNKI